MLITVVVAKIALFVIHLTQSTHFHVGIIRIYTGKPLFLLFFYVVHSFSGTISDYGVRKKTTAFDQNLMRQTLLNLAV